MMHSSQTLRRAPQLTEGLALALALRLLSLLFVQSTATISAFLNCLDVLLSHSVLQGFS